MNNRILFHELKSLFCKIINHPHKREVFIRRNKFKFESFNLFQFKVKKLNKDFRILFQRKIN